MHVWMPAQRQQPMHVPVSAQLQPPGPMRLPPSEQRQLPMHVPMPHLPTPKHLQLPVPTHAPLPTPLPKHALVQASLHVPVRRPGHRRLHVAVPMHVALQARVPVPVPLPAQRQLQLAPVLPPNPRVEATAAAESSRCEPTS